MDQLSDWLNSIVVAAIAGGLMSIAIAVLNDRLLKPKTKAEMDEKIGSAAENISEAWLKLLAPMKAQIKEMQEKLESLERENSELRLLLVHERRVKMWFKEILARNGIAIPPMPKDFRMNASEEDE